MTEPTTAPVETTDLPALTLRICEDMVDWYVIERRDHDGRQWLAKTDYGMAFMTSARFSDADVEGTASEMMAIAHAIKARGNTDFRRCSVRIEGARAHFSSPRNSMHDGTTSLAHADALADEIIEKLQGKMLPP